MLFAKRTSTIKLHLYIMLELMAWYKGSFRQNARQNKNWRFTTDYFFFQKNITDYVCYK